MAIISGCQAFLPQSPTTDSEQGTRLQAQAIGAASPISIDELFAEVARRVPAFAGFFYDEQGNPTIYLTDSREKASAEAAIVAVFGPYRSDIAELIRQRGTQVLQGRYELEQLKEWKDRLLTLHTIPGVVLTDIDDRNNRLTVGLETLDVSNQVQQALSNLRIPLEAINLEETGLIEYATHKTLQSYSRPVEGGFQIQFGSTIGSTIGSCTLGFNAIRSGASGFVTNSHCTAQRSVVEGTLFGQNRLTSANRIGVETADPPFLGAPTWGCPSNRRCRMSDSAFATYDSGVSFNRGYIARTLNLGSITINDTTPTYRITAEASSYFSGETLNKMGRTTGWTQGPVDGVCMDISLPGTDITMLCQGRVKANVDRGDSGSPVFRITNSPSSGDITLYGILWGRQSPFWPWDPVRFYFSIIWWVETELGSLATCASGFSC